MVQNKGVAANTMAFKSGLSRERGRRRRKFAWRSTLWLAAVAGFAAIGYSSYQAGIVLAHQEVSGLENNLASLTGKLAAVKSENDRLRTDLGQTRQATDILKKRYDADVPAGALARLVDLLRLRLAGGLPDERIARLLREAGPVRACDGRVVRKRFAIQTAGQGAEEPVSLLDGLVLVSASAPAGPEDPSKTAQVTITEAWAPQAIKATGLPVQQSITVNNLEMKLLVESSGVRGYGSVSLSVCGKG